MIVKTNLIFLKYIFYYSILIDNPCARRIRSPNAPVDRFEVTPNLFVRLNSSN